MAKPFLDEILSAFPNSEKSRMSIEGAGELPSWFDVTGLACASILAAGSELAGTVTGATSPPAALTVNRRLASFWFGFTVRPQGWEMPPAWYPIAGDYRTQDGWIRLHTNAPHHRAAALSVLGEYQDRDSLAPVVERWTKAELEHAVVEAGGCAAAMNDLQTWSAHPQGAAVGMEPLVRWESFGHHPASTRDIDPQRPLKGLRACPKSS